MRRIHSMFAAFAVVLGAAASTRADGTPPLPTLEIFDGSWTEYNHDFSGSRTNFLEHTLSKSNVGGLKVKWQYPTAGPVTSTPAVADGILYAGDGSGVMYALTTAGSLVWKVQLQSAITASAAIVGPLVVIGDQAGNLYGLRRSDGSTAWTTHPDPHPFAAIYSSAVRIGPFAAIGISSNEEAAAGNPKYPCCTFRGSVLFFDPMTGRTIWQTHTISDADRVAGASGAGVWSTPTFDVLTQTVFVTTGNNYSKPTTGTSDAFMALDVFTGAVKWVNQRIPNDSWNFRYSYTPGSTVDADFGDSPQVYWAGGRRVVGAGSKDGFYHVLDAVTGQLINQVQVEPGGVLGGLFADSAVAGGVVYANGSNWPGSAPSQGLPPTAGDLIAIAGDGSHELWRFTTAQSADMSGVAVANGVVYFTSTFAATLFALDATSGAPLAAVKYGVAFSGPAVADGHVYAGSGINFGPLNVPGAITAFGL
jgi:polyvinyl alcohol dehydrogenase (cytochrome)